ncbi:helix-turn-helix domain-containing protein [Macrococcoides caseolyticum]|uniref:helix-turn-helix domain-containing protein n=1 Tax=Macrococcoides caseolyticum TaxID=69966 RepID=UPI001E5644BA|nr:helix-turn-helix domain-containing protein [Macrococcus caseolyticus]
MSKVINLIDKPHPSNTLLSSDQVGTNEMIYCKVSTLPKLFDVSKPTCYRFLKEAEQMDEFKNDICIDISSNLTLVHIETFKEFLKTKHKKYL